MQDVNDNCPLVNSSSTRNFFLDPPLSETISFVAFESFDSDSEQNARLFYFVGDLAQRFDVQFTMNFFF